MSGNSQRNEAENSSGDVLGHQRGGHETFDANVRNVLLPGAGLFVLIGIGLLMAWGVYALTRALAVRPGATPETFTTVGALPPEPRLQSDPHADLVKLRAAEDSVLLSYGWVNRDSGLGRIPISRAMALIVERGLPERREGPPATAIVEAAKGKR